MPISDLLIWSDHKLLSLVVWAVIVTVLGYLARLPVHRAILSLTRVLHRALRLAAGSVSQAENRLQARNREVLLAAGREAAERMVEREFERVDAAVRKDLAEYPALHRHLSEVVTRIDEDFKESTEVPPSPPGWVKAVEAVAKIPPQGDSMVANVLKSIQTSLNKAHESALRAYRKSSRKRHSLLTKMMPAWRQVNAGLRQVDRSVNSLLERSKTIDRHMDEYERVIKGTDHAVHMLSSSSMTQFFIASLVMCIAIGGAMINFNLIARPMAEMVGGGALLMGYKTANIAALVIILVEVAMGLFLMESLRITRLFPVIGALNDKMRVRMIWITFSILLVLASVEAGLAYMREILAQDDAMLRASLLAAGGEGMIDTSDRWITTAAQMGMGFILPFALVFVAIPLESFVHSLRTVLGMMAVSTLRMTAFMLRLMGNIFRHIGIMLVQGYDLLIFVPLWIEQQVKGREEKPAHSKPGVRRESRPVEVHS